MKYNSHARKKEPHTEIENLKKTSGYINRRWGVINHRTSNIGVDTGSVGRIYEGRA